MTTLLGVRGVSPLDQCVDAVGYYGAIWAPLWLVVGNTGITMFALTHLARDLIRVVFRYQPAPWSGFWSLPAGVTVWSDVTPPAMR